MENRKADNPSAPRRVMDTSALIRALRELTEQGKEVQIPVSGHSMTPFLVHERDAIAFKKPDRPLRVGDMVFFERRNGQFIMHRIQKICPEGYAIVGDEQTVVESPIAEEQIFGLVTRVRRKGRWIGPGNFWWWFFGNIWIRMVRLRKPLLRIYTKLNAHRKKR